MTDFTPASSVVFTLPGRLGDNLARLPIAARYARSRGVKVDICVDGAYSASALLPLLGRLPWVSKAWAASGITSDGCGGQPFDFGAPRWFHERYQEVYHCGYRRFPRWGCLTDESVPPNWPADLSKEGLLSERPLGLDWVNSKGIGKHSRIVLSAKSSRPWADESTKATLMEAWPAIRERFHSYFFDPQEHERPLYEVAEEFEYASVVVTTYSAMCQLATLVGAPCVVLIPEGGYGLGHYDSRTPWYPGWEIATEGDAKGLIEAVDRAIGAACKASQQEGVRHAQAAHSA